MENLLKRCIPVLKRSTSLALAFVMILTMTITSIVNVSAAGKTSITLVQDKTQLQYTSGWNWYSAYLHTPSPDNTPLYCINPNKPAPPTGTYSTETSSNNMKEIPTSQMNYNLLRKTLYYCYGGDGFYTKLSAFDNKTMEKYMDSLGSKHWLGSRSNQWELYYLLTHITVSYVYGYEGWNKTTNGDAFPKDWQNAVKELTAAIKNSPDVPISTKLYVLNTGKAPNGANYQQVLVQMGAVKLQLVKASANTSLTNGSKCYTLKGAKYNIYLDKECKNYFSYITTDDNGYGKYGDGADGVDAPVQSYYCKEVKAPNGYALDTNVYEFKNTGKSVNGTPIYKAYNASANNFTLTDEPFNDPLVITVKKVDENDYPLPGAEFTVKYYNNYYNTTDELEGVEPTAWWILKTDDKGRASLTPSYRIDGSNINGKDFYFTSGENPMPCIPLGTVTVQETKAPVVDGKPFELNPEIKLQQVTSPDSLQGTAIYNTPTIVDVPVPPQSQIMVYKTDAYDDLPVSDVSYGVYTSDETDSNGMLLEVNRITSLRTNKNGYSHAVKCDAGTYYIQEMYASSNTLTSDGTFHNGANYYLSKEIYTTTVAVGETAQTHIIKATDNPIMAVFDKTTMDGATNVIGATLQLTDTTKNKVVDTWETNGMSHYVRNLSIGHSYKLEEIVVPDGYTTAAPITFQIDGKVTSGAGGNIIYNNSDNQKPVEITMKESTTSYQFIKKAEDGSYPSGARLQVVDSENNAVYDWTTDGTSVPYEVKGLVVGETYTFREIEAPLNCVLADDITFTVGDTADIQTITMTDNFTETEIYKTDITGTNEIEGAKLQVEDSTGTVVDKWTSEKNPHIIKGLERGQEYTLKETQAPDGYIVAEDVKFTVNYDGSVTQVYMKDDVTKTEIHKTDITGTTEIEGAKLQVKDSKGVVVDEWTSGKTPHTIEKLVAGQTYTLIEVSSPDGYVVAENVDFTVNSDGTVTKVYMKDDTTKVQIIKVDEDNVALAGAKLQVIDKNNKVIDEWTTDGTTHNITGKLIENATYTLHEVSAPDGYLIAADKTFKVGKETVVVTMTDKKTVTEITKTNLTGTKELEGATLTVTDAKGKIVDRWESTTEAHIIKGLTANATYTLTEIASPNGYATAESITFTVKSDGTTTTVTMKDAPTKVEFIKLDDMGNAVKGAKLQVIDTQGLSVVAEWTTDGVNNYTIEGKLVVGKTYTLHEVSIEGNYELASDVSFTVSDTATVQKVTMIDTLKGSMTLTKKDRNDAAVEGVEFKVFNAKNNTEVKASLVNGKYEVDKNGTATLTTDKNGVIFVNGLSQGDYYVVETKATNGFQLQADRIDFSITSASVEALNAEVSVIEDVTPEIPRTGGMGLTPYILITAGVLVVGGFTLMLIMCKRRNKKTED